ncbi:hypothetical protein O181_005598 [Austropuccinia psidii MF-1]|uniref:Uncharacterized protein n=1 Tax=Austropuccinia psidii MF-1 TaxID=1389203 RepID=A0A9Q3BIU2_9BASI|nr:hypothetical protein [Austropuccinia psidii MF-1]
MTNACDAFRQAHKKCLFVVQPFRPHSQRSSLPRRLCEDSFVVSNDESIPEREWTPGLQTGRWNDSGLLALSPQVLICPPPLLGHHPMVTSLLDHSKVIIPPMKQGNGKRTFDLGLIVTHEENPPNPPQQDSPVPRMAREQALRKPTPGPSGTQWLGDLFCKPSQHNEPHIPGPSQASEPHEDPLTCEPEPEMDPTQSTEEPFDPPSLHSYPGSFPRDPSHFPQEPNLLLPPGPSSLQSPNEAWQEFTDLQLTLMIPQAIVH